jgi:formylglycine-generating enzyme required for sulfatase activity
MRRLAILAIATLGAACGGGSTGAADAAADAPLAPLDAPAADAPIDAPVDAVPLDAPWPDAASPCPADMVELDSVCMDRYEAPNVAGALPLVMYTFLEAEDWCVARGKRLCYDDEWQTACEGTEAWAYPYGDTHDPGVCNDEETWLTYNQTLLNGWPASASSTTIASLDALYAAAAAVSTAGADAADHVADLYQGEGSGTNTGCVGAAGVYDLTGNVEEWTRRRDGGEPQFHGKLKGRYWAETRTCQNGVTVHGDSFRFYEIGFRCCQDLP